MKKNKKNDMVCETSSIRFGKLDIVLQSFNSVPDIASFYNTTSAGVTNTTTLLVHGNNTHNNTTLCDIVPCSINRRFTPITSENIGGDVMCWWCHVNVISVSNSCFLPSNYDEKKKCYSKHGYFCCWECTKSFNFETRDVKSGYRSYLIHQICRQYYGINQARSIKYARHWMELKKFGGNIDDEQVFEGRTCTTLESKNLLRNEL